MSTEYSKPLPELNDFNRPFWEACRNNRLELQKCSDCSHIRYPVSHVCPECLSEAHEWVKVSGRGTVWSSIVFHQVYNKAFAADVPYNVAMIQLDEGPRMISNVVGVPPSQVKVGDVVEVIFDAVTPEVSIPRFRPVR